jgi:prepilin-type N-terminal cleavage/methylation domain-containing protein
MRNKNNPPILNSFPPREKEAARAFTLVELIVVITILAIL